MTDGSETINRVVLAWVWLAKRELVDGMSGVKGSWGDGVKIVD